MRFAPGSLLLTFVGLSLASVDSSVYIFQGDRSSTNLNTPVLSLEQARLILAHRLGLSNDYELTDVSESTLSYINRFGKNQISLFEPSDETVAELVLIVDGISSKIDDTFYKAWSSLKPDFYVSRAYDVISPKLLAAEFQKLVGNQNSGETLKNLFNPSKTHKGPASNVIYFDVPNKKDRADQLNNLRDKIQDLAKNKKMNTAIFLIQEVDSLVEIKTTSSNQNEKVLAMRRGAEEPMISHSSILSSPLKQIQAPHPFNQTFKGVPQLCHKSIDACISSTKNCSGHGECLAKYKDSDDKGACFACTCRATNETITWAKGSKKGWTINYWGGSACHKQDVSSAFWLITIFTIVITGVVTWGVGMLYSIGEEKLPGVIGAGVSNSKSRTS